MQDELVVKAWVGAMEALAVIAVRRKWAPPIRDGESFGQACERTALGSPSCDENDIQDAQYADHTMNVFIGEAERAYNTGTLFED